MNNNFQVTTAPDGSMQTVEATPSTADPAATRRALREMLAGNVQFHIDPLAAPAKPAPPTARPSPVRPDDAATPAAKLDRYALAKLVMIAATRLSNMGRDGKRDALMRAARNSSGYIPTIALPQLIRDLEAAAL